MISQYFSHPLRKHKPIKKDPQAHRVYQMEKEIVGWSVDSVVPQNKLQELADHCCRKYKAPNIKIVTKSLGKGSGFGYCDYDSIVLNKDWHGANYATLIHELAHHLTFVEYGASVKDHGPEFVGVYRELLDRYRMLPKDCFDVLASRYEVEYNERA